MNQRPKFIVIFIIISLSMASLVACKSAPQVEPTASNTQSIEPPTQPTLTTPTILEEVVWVIGEPPADTLSIDQVISTLEELAGEQDWRLVWLDSLLSMDQSKSIRAIISFLPIENISTLSADFPDTHFIQITNTVTSASSNISVIYVPETHASFLAGYTATLIAPDFRSAGLILEKPEWQITQNAFLNGGHYLCGRCASAYAPVTLFPITSTITPGSEPLSWENAFIELDQKWVETLFLPLEGVQPEFLDFLLDENIAVISTALPPDGYNNLWAAVIQPDLSTAIKEIWNSVLDNQGNSYTALFTVTSLNEETLTPGRTVLANQVAADLQAGLIEPLSIP